MNDHCTLLREMLRDERKAPGEYKKLLKSICSFDKKACREMSGIVREIIEDEKWHAKEVEAAIEDYCGGK